MDDYREEVTDEVEEEVAYPPIPTVRTSIKANGRSIQFDAEGLREYEVSRLHEGVAEQATQIRQQTRESQLIKLVAFSQFLLFLVCGLTLHSQLRIAESSAIQRQIQTSQNQ